MTTTGIYQTSVHLCPYIGWIDEEELCLLWNQIQNMNTVCNSLIAGNTGRRVRHVDSLLPFVNMTQLEYEVINAYKQAYSAILPCCFPAQDCDEAALLGNTSAVGNYEAQLEAHGHVSQHFGGNFTVQEARLAYLDANCGNVPTQAPTTPSYTSAGPTTPVACCPEFPDPATCVELCAVVSSVENIIFGRRQKRDAGSETETDTEQSLLANLIEAFIIIENCVEFDICNASHAASIAAKLENFPTLVGGMNSDSYSEKFRQGVDNITRAIAAETAKARQGNQTLPCPAWIEGLHLDGTLTGCLCFIFTAAPDPICYPDFQDVINDVKDVLDDGWSSGLPELYLRLADLHEQCGPAPSQLIQLQSYLTYHRTTAQP
jgi:hypothetical protein